MSEDVRPKDVLLGLYTAEAEYINAGGPLAQASFEPVAAWLHPDVEMIQADNLPYPGLWKGADGVEAFFRAMAEVWSSLEISNVRIIEDGEGAIVHLQMTATSRVTGRVYDAPMLQLIGIEDQLIRRMQPFYWDTALVQQVCGAPPA